MEREAMQNSFALRMAFWILKAVARIETFVFNRSLYVSAMLAGVLIALPGIGAWWLFALAHYLPHPWRAVVIWIPTVLVIILAGTVDYLKSR